MELSQMTALELSRNIRGKKICVSDSVESVFHQIRKKKRKFMHTWIFMKRTHIRGQSRFRKELSRESIQVLWQEYRSR